MTELDETNEAIEALGLQLKMSRPDAETEQLLFYELSYEFVDGKTPTFWWEFFTKPYAWITYPRDDAYQHFSELLPSISEPCWFLPHRVAPEVDPIFDTTPELVAKVLAECCFFEYYLIAKDLRWLLCENHHSVVYGLGDEVIDLIGRARLRLESERQSKNST